MWTTRATGMFWTALTHGKTVNVRSCNFFDANGYCWKDSSTGGTVLIFCTHVQLVIQRRMVVYQFFGKRVHLSVLIHSLSDASISLLLLQTPLATPISQLLYTVLKPLVTNQTNPSINDQWFVEREVITIPAAGVARAFAFAVSSRSCVLIRVPTEVLMSTQPLPGVLSQSSTRCCNGFPRVRMSALQFTPSWDGAKSLSDENLAGRLAHMPKLCGRIPSLSAREQSAALP